MNTQQTQVLQECAQGAWTGKFTFPEIIGKLAEIGVERYHADYSRQEITYYLPDGDSLVGGHGHPPVAFRQLGLVRRGCPKQTLRIRPNPD